MKRDDLLDFYLSGNKYRKLFSLLKSDLSSYGRILSYGGIQSNAMLSIARLAQQKNLPFDYHVRYASPQILDAKVGNFFEARRLGLQLHISSAASDEALGAQLRASIEDDTLFIPQGGASPIALEGVAHLAQEILQWQEANDMEKLFVATPSGTGTTAWYLQHVLGERAQVLTIACVGDESYLGAQMARALPSRYAPTILTTQKSYRFGMPHLDLWAQYEAVLAQGVEVDLLYAPVMLQALVENVGVWREGYLLYVHSGGVIGNATQKVRYAKLFGA